jgi:hypothetical protein
MQHLKGSLIQILVSNLLSPIIYGLVGYIIFFVTLTTIKSMVSLISSFSIAAIIHDDLLFSTTGFILFFTIKMLERHK